MGEMQQDRNMEDVLASIRRVIADDNRVAVGGAPRRKPLRAERAPAEDEDVLELEDPVATEPAETLLSETVAAASRERLAALTALSAKPEVLGAGPSEGALEAVVRDMLRPMLKDWLDQHLPEIVEQLVTREIARITGRG